jgi:hypothetical protein
LVYFLSFVEDIGAFLLGFYASVPPFGGIQRHVGLSWARFETG